MHAYINAIEQTHGKRRYKLWVTGEDGRRHYSGAYQGVESLARAIAGKPQGTRYEIEADNVTVTHKEHDND